MREIQSLVRDSQSLVRDSQSLAREIQKLTRDTPMMSHALLVCLDPLRVKLSSSRLSLPVLQTLNQNQTLARAQNHGFGAARGIQLTKN